MESVTENIKMNRVLFLCTGNSCRSQMAEAFARGASPDGVETISAGTDPAASVNPLAVTVMKEIGIDISNHKTRDMKSFDSIAFDAVITLCNHARENCPPLPGTPPVIPWNLPDPASATGTDEEIIEVFRNSRDRIRQLVFDFFERGYYDVILSMKRQFSTVLNNLTDGIIVHDLDRRILHFNKAAERITGHPADQVVGHDCHETFPEGFCGGKCSFRGNAVAEFDHRAYPVEMLTRDGEKRRVEMSVVPMYDETGATVGVIASFKDTTRIVELESRLEDTRQFDGIIGKDHKMQAVFNLIRDLSESDAPVLIQGETGTGKELVAAAIHNESRRAGNLFVPVNCGALPEGTIESELFGHVRGAFTGAVRDKKGRFELADGGTIFLDEIGEMPFSIQVKLLRVLQEGTIERVGDEKIIKVNVRAISATNRDLKNLMEKGVFREDLYYRLCVVPVTLPPLRERRNDILLLAEHFLKTMSSDSDSKEVRFSADSVDVLLDYYWPGNVRQLQNAIQFALVKCRGDLIEPIHLPPEVCVRPDAATTIKPGRRRILDENSVRAALESTGGNKSRAAKLLGVARATLYRFIDDM